MNFLNPFLLLGVLAVAVPVLIHLINLRKPRKIAFSTLAFLKELQKSTIKRIRIKQYLLMTLRVLAVLFLALALARPYLPPTFSNTSKADEPGAVAIIIDNSPSMERVGSKGPLIEQAQEVALQLMNSSLESNRYLILGTNGTDRENRMFAGSERAKEQAAAVSVSQAAHYTSETIRAAYQQLQESPLTHASIYLISDGQATQLGALQDLDLPKKPASKPVSFQMINLESVQQQNLAVSDVRLQSQMISVGSPVTVSVTIQNVGEVTASNQFVSLEVDNELSGQYEFSLDAGQEEEFRFEIIPETTGDIPGRILIEGDEIGYDNIRNFVIRVPESRSVLLVNSGRTSSDFFSYLQPALRAAQKTNTQINFEEKSVSEVDQGTWQTNDAIILDGLRSIPEYWFGDLQRFVQAGKGVIFFPSEQGDIQNYNSFFSQFNAGLFDDIAGEYASFKTTAALGSLEEGHPVVNELFAKQQDETINIDFPELFFYYHYKQPSNTGAYTILQATNGDPLLSEQRFGEGVLLISSLGADPGWSNFPVHPLFAPLFYRSTLYASTTESGGFQQHVIGKPFVWEGYIEEQNLTLHINDIEVKPSVQRYQGGLRVEYDGKDWQPGFLQISNGNEKRLIAVNQDIMESHFETLDTVKLRSWLSEYMNAGDVINAGDLSIEDLSVRLQSAGFGKEIWNWFIWIALLFLIGETVISKWYKTGSTS